MMKATYLLTGPVLVFSLMGLQAAEAGKPAARPAVRAGKLHVLRTVLPRRDGYQPRQDGYRPASIATTKAVQRELQGLGILHPAGIPITRDAKGRTFHHESSKMLNYTRRLGVLVSREPLSRAGQRDASWAVQIYVGRKGGVTKANSVSPATIKLDSKFKQSELGPGVHLAKLVGAANGGAARLERLTEAELVQATKVFRGTTPGATNISRVKDLHELK
jgi:hypothetical protein